MRGHACSSPAPAQRPLHNQVSPTNQTWTLGVALARRVGGPASTPNAVEASKQASKRERERECVCLVVSPRPDTNPGEAQCAGALGVSSSRLQTPASKQASKQECLVVCCRCLRNPNAARFTNTGESGRAERLSVGRRTPKPSRKKERDSPKRRGSRKRVVA